MAKTGKCMNQMEIKVGKIQGNVHELDTWENKTIVVRW